MVGRGNWGLVAAVLGVATAVVGTFLPWVHSGSEARSSYEIFDLVERLGFTPDGPVSWSLRLWALVPLVLVMAALTAWGAAVDRVPLAVQISTGVVVTLWVGGTSGAVVLVPDAGLVRVGDGPWVTLSGVVVYAAGSTWIRRREAGSSATA